MADLRPILERYRESYDNFMLDKDYERDLSSKLIWAASYVFGLVTYDDEMSKNFANGILGVCKVILAGKTYELIEKNETYYLLYLLVVQLLNQHGWIDWGTSIRGAWFYDLSGGTPILIDEHGEVPFTATNLRVLIDFIYDKEKQNEKVR